MKKNSIILVTFYLLALISFTSCKNEILNLKQPESVVATDEFIYVSNVNGNPTEKDSNGFISKLYKNGKVYETIFIDGLDAPKGICLIKNILYVTDIDKILGFDIYTKNKLFEYQFLNGKTNFLNDLCSDGNDNLYVTAMDINEIFQINIKTKTVTPLHLSNQIFSPNGIIFANKNLYVCEFGNDTTKGGICKIEFKNDSIKLNRILTNIGYLDGIQINNNLLYFSDWVTFDEGKKLSKIWCINLETNQLISIKTNENMSGCADIFFDKKNNRIIVPLMNENRLFFIPL